MTFAPPPWVAHRYGDPTLDKLPFKRRRSNPSSLSNLLPSKPKNIERISHKNTVSLGHPTPTSKLVTFPGIYPHWTLPTPQEYGM